MAGRQTSEEKIAGDPPDTGGTTGTTGTYQPQPIGVPPGYVAKNLPGKEDDLGPRSHQHTIGGGSQAPRYYDGSEFGPANWDPARIADLQRRMIAGGLIPKSANVHIGVWDATSQAGFRELLAYANTSGDDWLTALGKYATSESTNPSGREPLVTQPSNPDELRQVFRKAIIDELGQGWDQGRIDRMVASYQADEVAAQTSVFNAAETGGAVTPPPPPAETYAVTQARAQDPGGAQAHDALGYQNEFFNALGGVV